MPRVENDVYETPPELAKAIITRLALIVPEPAFIIEPSAGSGAFIKACKETWNSSKICAVDLRPECEQKCISSGANEFHLSTWENASKTLPIANLIVGNPPYKFAKEHTDLALEHIQENGHVAFLLRLGFLGSRKRYSFWHESHFKALIPISGRPSFTGGGTDAHEYGIFIWQRGYAGETKLLTPIWNPNGRS